MTDNEIRKALECCGSEKGNLCTLCPKFKELGDNCIETDLFKEALNLINRQKAENERLLEEKQTITDNFNCQQTVYLDLSEIIKKQANELKTAKSEAIKEFAERLKAVSHPYADTQMVFELQIDNLVKEMAGD